MLLLLITMLDGSQVNLNVDKATYFDVGTKYGTLKVPLEDVAVVTFGVHYDDEKPYQDAVKGFASGKYKSRDEAFKMLAKNQRWAWKFLKSVDNDKDLEVKKRAEALLKLYKAAPPLTDDVGLKVGSMEGNIKQTEITGESVSLGKLTIKVSQIKELRIKAGSSEFSITLADGWKRAGYISGTCSVSAFGVVDMWPQQPGQWTATPNGGNNGSTVFENYPAGALLGKLNGKTFLVGSNFYAENMGRGELELRVNGAPWSTTFEGEYRVKVE